MRCVACNGLKKVMQIGMRMGECRACKGTGKEIDKPEVEPEPEAKSESVQLSQTSKDASYVKKDHKNNSNRKK